MHEPGASVEHGLLEALDGAEVVFLGEVADFYNGHVQLTTKAPRKEKGDEIMVDWGLSGYSLDAVFYQGGVEVD